MAPLPAPNVPSAPPIPGVSQPGQGGPDRLGDLARMVGGIQGNSQVTAMQHMQNALNELRQAAAADPKISELVQTMLASFAPLIFSWKSSSLNVWSLFDLEDVILSSFDIHGRRLELCSLSVRTTFSFFLTKL